MTFEKWLEKEHGPISVYDFEHRSAMERWIDDLRGAFKAGLSVNAEELSDLRWRIEGLEK